MHFRGRSLRSLDPKGRLMLPPEFRESLVLRTLSERSGAVSDGSSFLAGQNNAQAEETKNGESKNAESKNSEDAKFVLTTYDGCLVGFPWSDWVELEEKFARLPNPSPNVRAFRRLFIGGAEVQTLDAQGRVRLSQDHREYAGLEKDITVMGLINRFEIWNPKTLKASLDEQKLDSVTEELASSGIAFAL